MCNLRQPKCYNWCILKSWDITLLTKVWIGKAMVFQVVMYGCERTQRRLRAEELMLLNCDAGEDSWTARRSNQSILKEINPEYSLEGLMLKLKLQSLATWCKEPTHWKRPWCWGKLRAGGEGVTEDEMVGDDIIDSKDMSLSKLQEIVKDRKPGGLRSMGLQSWTQLSEWTATDPICLMSLWEEGNLDIETETNRKKAMWWWRQRLESSNTKDCWQPPESRRETWNTFPSEPSKRS